MKIKESEKFLGLNRNDWRKENKRDEIIKSKNV